MPTAVPRVIALRSAMIDPATKNLVFTVRTEDQSWYEIPVHPGILGVITTMLLSFGNAVGPAPNARAADMQRMQLTAVRAGIHPDGQLVLRLDFENGLHLPVKFPSRAVRGLQVVLADLKKTSAASQARPRQRH